MSRVLLLGGTSTIARALTHELAACGKDITLAGRDRGELERTATDTRIRYDVDAGTLDFRAQAPKDHRSELMAFLDEHGDELEGVFWCIGYLGPPPSAGRQWSHTRRTFEVNLLAAASALELVADRLEAEGEGYLCAVSSVAGDRGRASNYPYGASKAGLSTYLQGLRQRLAPSGVQVVTVKPGFVDTKMTYGDEGMFLVASPERVAKGMLGAVDKGRDVVYVPWFWRPILFALKSIPEPLFKRLRL